MARFLLFLFVILGVNTGSIHAAVTPAEKNIPPLAVSSASLKNLLKMKLSDIEKISGRKLSFREKLQIRTARLALRMIPAFEEGIPTPKQAKQGTKSFTCGVAAILCMALGLFVPFVGLFSLPLGIVALVLGIKSIKGNGNTPALLGIITGSLVTFFWLIAAVAIIILISSGGIWG